MITTLFDGGETVYVKVYDEEGQERVYDFGMSSWGYHVLGSDCRLVTMSVMTRSCPTHSPLLVLRGSCCASELTLILALNSLPTLRTTKTRRKSTMVRVN